MEGGDALGKETQTKKLVAVLREKGYAVALVEVPFNDGLTYSSIYRMLETGSAVSHPNAFQALQFLNKLVFQTFVLPYHLLMNDYVVFDRWSLSMIAYGDAGRAAPFLTRLYHRMLLKPHKTLVLTGEPFPRDGRDAYELNMSLQRRVSLNYRIWARLLPNHTLVDANQSIEDVHRDVMAYVCNTAPNPINNEQG